MYTLPCQTNPAFCAINSGCYAPLRCSTWGGGILAFDSVPFPPSKISFKGVCVYRGFLEHKPRSAGKQQSRKAKRLCHMFLRCYVLEGDCCRKEVLVSVCCRGKHGCRMCFCFLLQSSSGCALYLFNFWNNHIPPPPFLWLGAKYVLF